MSVMGTSACSGGTLDDLLDPFLVDETYKDHDRSLNKYEFIASELGIVHAAHDSYIRSIVGRFCTALKFPGMVATYYSALVLSKDEDHGLDLSLYERLAFGALVSAVTFFILDGVGDYLSNKSDDKISIINNYIENWPAHKIGTPEEFHELFDTLHMEYLNNNQTVQMNEIFADEILRNVASAYIASLAKKKLTHEFIA